MSSKTAAAKKRKEQKMRPEQKPGPDELLAAAQFGNLGAVERLVDSGMDVNALSAMWQPLMMVVGGGDNRKTVGAWVDEQWRFGKAFKKPASERSSTEKRNAGKTTRRRVALLGGIGFF